MPGRGRVKAEEIDGVIGDYIAHSSLLCTDTANNYKKFAAAKNLKHETVNLNQNQRVKKGIFHIQHVNNFHHRLKGWMERFQGVGTYYLDSYLYWYRWLELHKNLAFENRVEQMLIYYFTIEAIRKGKEHHLSDAFKQIQWFTVIKLAKQKEVFAEMIWFIL